MTVYLLFVALGFYLASTCLFFLALFLPRPKFERSGQLFLLGGFAVHLVSLVLRYIQAGYAPVTSFHEALSFLSLCIAGFFIYLKRSYQIRALGGIILPVLSALLLWSLAYPTAIKPLPPALDSWLLPVHVLFSFLGNAVFIVTFFVSILYLVVDREIKKKKGLALSGRLPSLETLDRVNYRCMSYGFPFLTAGIVTGSIWAGIAWKSYWSWDPKETWSLITWIVYAILIHNRLTLGWRGRKTAYMMILGFLAIVMTFVGVNFLLKGLHSYV